MLESERERVASEPNEPLNQYNEEANAVSLVCVCVCQGVANVATQEALCPH